MWVWVGGDYVRGCYDPVLVVGLNVQNEIRPYNKALRYTEFSEPFFFTYFGNVRLSKFRNFSEKNQNFQTRKIFSKKVRKKVWKFKFGKKFGY